MKRLLLLLPLLSVCPAFPEEWEPPHFSLQGSLGANTSTGFIQGDGPRITGGLWVGASLDEHFDGFWALDYHSLSGYPVTVSKAVKNGPSTLAVLEPTDDLFISVDLRWYLTDRWDRLRGTFKESPYLVGGLGMSLLIDPLDPPANLPIYNKPYDLIFGVNLGAGMDFPLGNGKQWILFAEAFDHILLWQGVTQVPFVRVGLRAMLDSEHLDPFR